MLSDSKIRERIAAYSLSFDPPLEDSQIQPASVDLRLGYEWLTYRGSPAWIDSGMAMEPEDFIRHDTHGGSPFVLEPGVLVLGTTLERVRIPDDLVARVEGKSTLGRLGVLVHLTAGFIDPGFCGNITLEILNVNKAPILLHPRMKICQLSFSEVSGTVERPYGHHDLGSHYQEQRGVVGPRINKEDKT